MQTEKTITIYDIAKEAEVSPATVSRVLTGSANVKNEKKRRIMALIDKYNFKPSAVARGLSDTKNRIIGIIVADIRNSFYADMYVACENAASREGYSVMLFNSFASMDIEKTQMEKLAEWRADAIIQLGGAVDARKSSAEYARAVNEVAGNIPFVVSGKMDGTDCYRVSIDHARALEMIAAHLYEKGNRRIALVGGRPDVLSTYIKYQRFLELTEKYDFERGNLYTENWGGYGFNEGEKTIDEMFKRFRLAGVPVPEAIICINDTTAAGAIKRINAEGLRIPENISVVSYDNVELCEIIEPSLSSVAYDYETIGKIMVKTAIDAGKGKEVSHERLVEPAGLVVRRSSNFERIL